MNRSKKTSITAIAAVIGRCLDRCKTIPWEKRVEYGLCLILLVFFIPMSMKGYLLLWEARAADEVMSSSAIFASLCLLMLLAALSMKQTPVSKPSWVWETLFWITLFSLGGISAIVCFAFVMMLRALSKGLRRKAENIPEAQVLDQETPILRKEKSPVYIRNRFHVVTLILLVVCVYVYYADVAGTIIIAPIYVWTALFFLVVIVCFAFVMTFCALSKGLRYHLQDRKAENIPEAQVWDQETPTLCEEKIPGDFRNHFRTAMLVLLVVVGVYGYHADVPIYGWIALFFRAGISVIVCLAFVMTLHTLYKGLQQVLRKEKSPSDFLRNHFRAASFIVILLVLGVYWKSLPSYPMASYVPWTYDPAYYVTNMLKPIEVDGKYGYVDETGKIVIAPIYDEVTRQYLQNFSSGGILARVKVNGKYGYIDRKGKEVTPLHFDEAPYLFGYCSGMVKVRIGDKWGWIDRRGKEVTPLRYDYTMEYPTECPDSLWELMSIFLDIHPASFDNRPLARVMADGKWGYVNIRGREIVPPRYDEIYDEKYISGGDVLALVREGEKWSWIGFDGKEITPAYLAEADAKNLRPIQFGDKWGYANDKGIVMIPPNFSRAQDFRADGQAIVMQEGEWGFIDANGKIQDRFPRLSEIDNDVPKPFPFFQDGKWGYCAQNVRKDQACANVVTSPRFGRAEAFPDKSDRAKVMVNGKWGYVDIIGKMVIPPQFDFAKEFDENELAMVERDGKWGYIDRFGKEIIPIRFDSVSVIYGKLVRVNQEDKFGFFNLEGKEVIQPRYDYILGDFDFDEVYGLIYVWHNKKVGIINTEGTEIVIPRYDEIREFEKNKLARIKLGSKWGIINTEGKEIIAPRYDGIESFDDNNQARVQLDKKWGLVDTTGREVIAPRYDSIVYHPDLPGYFDANGLARVRQNLKLGYVDAEGKEVIVPHFDSAGYADAATGYERVVINDKWGLVDLQGKEVLPLRFDLILDGHHVADDIIALARKGTKWHWFDKKGKKVVPDYVRQAKARNLTPKRFSDTYSYGYVNEHDAVVIPPRFDEAKDFDEHGLALVRLGEKWGWINRKGKIAIPLRFDVAAGFDVDARGLARVGIGESCAGDFEGYTGERHSRLCRWGFVDIRGREIIPLRFDEIGEFDDRGLAVVSRAGKWGIVDIRGGEIVPARFPELYFGELAGDAAALVREGNTWTWFDHKGRAVIPAHVRGTNARELRSWKSARNRVGYVDPEGRIVIPPRFDEAFERFISVDDTTEVKWRGRWVQIDARGRIVK